MNAASRADRQLSITGELLDELLPAARRDPALPALLQRRLARDRRFGARDRRIYRELVYAALRYLPWIEAVPAADRGRLALWLAPGEALLQPLRDALAGWPPVPDTLAGKALALRARFGRDFAAADLLPDWFAAEAPAALAVENLFTRPPVWLRTQPPTTAPVRAWLEEMALPHRVSPVLPAAIAMLTDADVTRSPLFAAGAFEVQDLGSQLVLALASPAPASRWLDACAGAGGKTLQLAGLVGPAGHVDATDIRPAALRELQQRAARARLGNIAVLAPASAESEYDGVLVDAPCSGCGTWRRHPHLKWQTSRADLLRQQERQLRLLAAHAPRVRVGGRLVYATCSLAKTENENVVGGFLSGHRHFRVIPPPAALGCAVGELGTTILPSIHDTDGFFVSLLERTA